MSVFISNSIMPTKKKQNIDLSYFSQHETASNAVGSLQFNHAGVEVLEMKSVRTS